MARNIYKAKTFDWSGLYGQIRHLIEDITGLDGKHVIMDYTSNELPSYPYVTISSVNKTAEVANSLHSREKEIADYLIQITCYSDNGNETLMMADDIATLLFDPQYKSTFHQYGAVLKECDYTSGSTNDFAGLFNVSARSLSMKLTLYRNYQSKVEKINGLDGLNKQ